MSLAAFVIPLWIWLTYASEIQDAGGLYAFVNAAAGRWVALAQAIVWTVSYALYLVYTTVQIVYDLLPAVVPGERHLQTLLALLIPAAIAVLMVAGRTAVLAVVGLLAVGQLVLTGILDGVTLGHVSTPLSSFGVSGSGRAVAKAGVQSASLYVCGSLPLFLGGELPRPRVVMRRGLIGAFVVTGVLVLLAVAPLASAPGVLRTAIPGATVAEEFSGQTLGEVMGIGVAASTAGLIILEFLALTRLLNAVGGWPIRRITAVLAVLMIIGAPLTLIDPDRIYNALLTPSLVGLWLSQLMVFAVFPRFVARRGGRIVPAVVLSAAGSAFAVYSLIIAVQQSTS